VALKKLHVWNRREISELRPRRKSRIFAEKISDAYFTSFSESTDIQCP
jgi:hypothetical protein